MGQRMEDLTDRRFGRLVVKQFMYKYGSSYYWRCVCDCGTICGVTRSALTTGRTQSCGCIRKERSSNWAREMTKIQAEYRKNRKMKAYKVTQKDTGTETYFSCISAIYDTLTPDIMGCGLKHLWNSHVSQTGFFENKKVTIQLVDIHSKKQNKD